MQKRRRKLTLAVTSLFLAGLLWPQGLQLPVAGASHADYHPDSFWHYPWGESVTHKGIDIFAEQGTPVYAAAPGWVLFSGTFEKGGKVALLLGPKWRLHYYAHLHELKARRFSFAHRQSIIGTVGTSGNAAGKPPHLHYSLLSLLPYPWRIDRSPQGWKKMFYLDPTAYW